MQQLPFTIQHHYHGRWYAVASVPSVVWSSPVFRKPAKQPPTPQLDQVAPASTPQQLLKTIEVDSAIAQLWETPHGTVAIVYPNALFHNICHYRYWQAWLDEFPSCRAVIAIGPGRGLMGGPDVFVHDREATEDTNNYHYEIDWADLNHLLGQPAPYWPTTLRTLTGMTGWSPAEPARTIAAAPEVDLNPVLRLAVRHAPETALHQTLIAFARHVLTRAAKAASEDTKFHREHRDGTEIRFAAHPADVAEPASPLDPATERAGWLHVLDLVDDDAYATTALFASYRRASAVLPTSTVATVNTGDPGAGEWIRRLRPCQRAARFALFPERYVKVTLIDPVTAAAVAFDGHDTYLAAVPSQIPSASPLAGVELQPGQVWIICEDGMRYLCPETGSVDVNWGYNGSGPYQLAKVLHALLDDINADIKTELSPAPGTLEAYCEHPWKPGTVLTREQLDQARQAPR